MVIENKIKMRTLRAQNEVDNDLRLRLNFHITKASLEILAKVFRDSNHSKILKLLFGHD